jgi:hypothetical protein
MQTNQTCKFCRWWHERFGRDVDWRAIAMDAQCHFHGPTIVKPEYRGDADTRWPTTRKDDFCSHFSTINARAEDA